VVCFVFQYVYKIIVVSFALTSFLPFPPPIESSPFLLKDCKFMSVLSNYRYGLSAERDLYRASVFTGSSEVQDCQCSSLGTRGIADLFQLASQRGMVEEFSLKLRYRMTINVAT
jgi:hypothetical protein